MPGVANIEVFVVFQFEVYFERNSDVTEFDPLGIFRMNRVSLLTPFPECGRICIPVDSELSTPDVLIIQTISVLLDRHFARTNVDEYNSFSVRQEVNRDGIEVGRELVQRPMH